MALFILMVYLLPLSCQRPNSEGQTTMNTLQKLLRTKELHVGYIILPPLIMKDPKTGQLTGHFVDMIEYIAKMAEFKVVYHEASWATFAGGLQSGQFDLSIAPTYATIPRAFAVAFTRPIIYVGNSAIVRRGETRFKSIEDFNRPDIVIAVTQGEQGHEYAKTNLPKATLKVISTSDQFLTFAEVSVGRADVALGDAWATKQYANTHPEVIDLFADNPYNLTPVAWAVRYGDTDFLNFINTSISYMESIGKLAEFEKKYDAHWLHPKLILEFY
jgi:polar amino acid transport system substrate-binding protein